MGASVSTSGDTVTISQSGLKSLVADFTHCIDLLPTMAILAATAEGTSVFSGIAKARLKESNRVSSIKDGLKRMGIEVVEEKYKLTITGGTLKGANIDSYNDHRIAMAFGVAGIIAGNTVIENAECVTKTYPRFWQDLKSLGGRVRIDG
jgi:3-phosphoshikimate 1-carboxyvinyltransferase